MMAILGCSSTSVERYAAEKPVLKLEDFFSGELKAWGVVQSRSGEILKRFVCTMTGTWTGDEGILDEDFVYADGTKQKRVWKLKKTGPNSYEGTAADVKGVAKGRVAGNAFYWEYVMLLPVDGKVYEVKFEDEMWLVDQDNLLNRAKMKKFGFQLGEVLLNIQRIPSKKAAGSPGT